MILQVNPNANTEVSDVLAWLVLRDRHKVANKIWHQWLSGLEKICEAPMRYPKVEDSPAEYGYRNYIFRKYGYRIVYQYDVDVVYVVAFCHGKQKPGYWLKRRLN